jgi:hypothetical protein
MLQSDPSPAELAEKTIDYAEAKTACFKALRAELPELLKIATDKEARPPELDTFAAALRSRRSPGKGDGRTDGGSAKPILARYPDIQKARAEFDRAQKAEESFHKDFDGLDFTGNRLPTCDRSCLAALRKAPNSP